MATGAEYCRLCKQGTERGIASACGKGNLAIKISLGILAVCFVLSGVAWSAKSDVRNFKEKVDDIHKEQKTISKEMSKIGNFIDLLQQGKIKLDGS